MEKFFAGMTAEDKQRMMEQMMPRMMGMMGGDRGGGMMGMMSQMMGGGQGTGAGTPMMGQMMTQMMPHCISTVLPGLPKNERVEFILKMIGTLMEHGSAGMSQEEKDDLVARALEAITA
jgi:hypothetical protein